MKTGALAKHIASLGYGSRREVARMMAEGRVGSADGRVLRVYDDCEHDDVRIDGAPLDPPHGVVIMLHKPTGYVCSTRDANPLVYDLLPPRFPLRSPVIAPVGRLDIDTSGLLLLTDDGALNHRITSPRSHLPKVYEATLADDLTGNEAALFASGTLMLKGEDKPLLPAVLEVLNARRARITLHEGRYHQARRMFAAAGNRVVALHRSALGSITLGDLPPGAWRILDPAGIAALEADLDRSRDE